MTDIPPPADPDFAPGSARAHPAQSGTDILLLDHRGDLQEIAAALVQTGHAVTTSGSLAETWQRFQAAELPTPSLIVASPLLLHAGSAELELLSRLQRGADPVPVLFVIESVDQLREARRVDLAFKDFLIRPCSTDEALGRVEQALLLRDRFRALQHRARDLEGQVSVDFKTGLLTDRHFQSVLGVEWKRAQRHQTPLSLLWIDVDDFKSVNDTTDYAFGDVVLAGVAASLRATIRETDFAARFGGDEFLVLLPQTTPAEAVQTALRIRRNLGAKTFANESFQRRVTLSIGIDTYDGRSPMTPDMLRRRANEALKEAKQRGKNRVWLYTERGAGAAEAGS